MSPQWNDSYEQLLRRYLPLLAAGVELRPDASMTALGLDSMETIRLLIEVEDVFGVSVPDELLTAEMFATPGALWQVVVELSAQENR